MVGQGTWNLEQGKRAGAIAALRLGLDLGMTHIDTAEMYGSGAAEEIVGEAIGGRRDEVFLVSKVLPHNASRKGTVAACERSLARLKTDRLDCYLLHWRGSIPLAETIAGMEELCRAGKIVSWGVSNFDEGDLEEARQIAGNGRIACNQVLYHLEERAIEHAVMPWCRRHDVTVVGYSPFGSGQFPANNRALRDIAQTHGATPRQVALRFQVEQGMLAIPKASNPDHARENAGAGDLRLSPEGMAKIDAAFPRGAKPRSLPML